MIESRSAPTALRRSVLVAIPAHNEDRFIGSLVLKLRSQQHLVLVVDDGSADATAKVAEAAGATVITHDSNQGKAAAVQTAFEHARSLGVDVLVLLDGDSQHDPGDVESLIEPVLAGEADMVVGSRFQSIRSRIPRWRVAGQRLRDRADDAVRGQTARLESRGSADPCPLRAAAQAQSRLAWLRPARRHPQVDRATSPAAVLRLAGAADARRRTGSGLLRDPHLRGDNDASGGLCAHHRAACHRRAAGGIRRHHAARDPRIDPRRGRRYAAKVRLTIDVASRRRVLALSWVELS